MVHDTSVRQALDYLIESQITENETEQRILTGYRDSIEDLIWLPFITTTQRAPLSCRPDDIVARLSALDPTVTHKVGKGFLSMEKTIGDAVYFLLSSGFKDTKLCDSFVQRGQELTELFLLRTETLLDSDAGESWSACKFFVAVAKQNPSAGELKILLTMPQSKMIAALATEQVEA